MEQMFEFVVNHPYLWLGSLIVLVMLIKSEYEYRANQSIQLNPINAIRLINNSDDKLIIDVRESSEFNKGHIKGAINQPLASFKDKLDDFSKNKDTVVLAYCASGAASGRACKILMQAGFSNVHNLAGGINGWLDAKLPVTKK